MTRLQGFESMVGVERTGGGGDLYGIYEVLCH